VLVGAGDIADCRSAGDSATAALLDDIAGTVFTLGDNAYEDGTRQEFNNCYGPTWGRHRSRTRPSPGNHEYRTAGAAGYFGYFGSRAGDPDRGYYAYNLGAWRIYSLNSNCGDVACGDRSAQVAWLKDDLAAHPRQCTLAYWHHPRYSSGHDGSHVTLHALWRALHDAGVEVLLTAHSHNYERFAPRDGNGRTSAVGIREFVVGTGGAFMTGLGSTRMAGSQAAQNHTFGVLKLTLHDSSYDWRFVPVAGKTWSDSGSGQCHGPPGSPLVPPPPAPTIDNTPPTITKLRPSPRRFRRRTVFHYTLSEPASVRIGLARRRGGRYRRVGKLSQAGVAGANMRPFRCIIGGKRLRPGRFRARVVARDAAGNYSSPVKARFRIR
jgi:hypothetical protein